MTIISWLAGLFSVPRCAFSSDASWVGMGKVLMMMSHWTCQDFSASHRRSAVFTQTPGGEGKQEESPFNRHWHHQPSWVRHSVEALQGGSSRAGEPHGNFGILFCCEHKN
ncbi:hypothetical protein QBC35DRAFT_135712 [Podospora australis]|uniref:Secreted protein n=1 Tax=Podospora australis TaxID=1536484 RepID=A0AAN6WMC3_9PEZI|nr:hypothetical protein QBC35DRAFT_135712 [Podospora australis]